MTFVLDNTVGIKILTNTYKKIQRIIRIFMSYQINDNTLLWFKGKKKTF